MKESENEQSSAPSRLRSSVWLGKFPPEIEEHPFLFFGSAAIIPTIIILTALWCRSLRMTNHPEYSERLNQAAGYSDPRQPQNTVSNPAIVGGNEQVKGVSGVTAPMGLTAYKSQTSTQFVNIGSPEPIMNLSGVISGKDFFGGFSMHIVRTNWPNDSSSATPEQ